MTARHHDVTDAAESDPDLRRSVRVGLVGRGIQLSRTPRMHEAEGAAMGIGYRYDLLDTDADIQGSLADIVSQAEADGFAGLNVTYPYKQDALALLDTLSDAAARVGAVNTIVFRDGKRFGHNADFWGFAESLRQGLPGVTLGTVLLIGAGGAGGAVAHALADLGARHILISDTRRAAAHTLAAQVNAAAGRADAASVAESLETAARYADGIVNATPVGMAKLPGSPLDASLLEPRHWVADIVYFPLETALLRAAAATGCRTLSGEGMAIFQAARAFELFTGKSPDPARMRATFRAMGDRGTA